MIFDRIMEKELHYLTSVEDELSDYQISITPAEFS